jgi:hypothetical protein
MAATTWKSNHGDTRVLCWTKYQGIRKAQIQRYQATAFYLACSDHFRISCACQTLAINGGNIMAGMLQQLGASISDVLVKLD